MQTCSSWSQWLVPWPGLLTPAECTTAGARPALSRRVVAVARGIPGAGRRWGSACGEALPSPDRWRACSSCSICPSRSSCADPGGCAAFPRLRRVSSSAPRSTGWSRELRPPAYQSATNCDVSPTVATETIRCDLAESRKAALHCGRQHCMIPCGMWVPVAVWQPCELLYTCYLLLYTRFCNLYNGPTLCRHILASK